MTIAENLLNRHIETLVADNAVGGVPGTIRDRVEKGRLKITGRGRAFARVACIRLPGGLRRSLGRALWGHPCVSEYSFATRWASILVDEVASAESFQRAESTRAREIAYSISEVTPEQAGEVCQDETEARGLFTDRSPGRGRTRSATADAKTTRGPWTWERTSWSLRSEKNSTFADPLLFALACNATGRQVSRSSATILSPLYPDAAPINFHRKGSTPTLGATAVATDASSA